MDRRVAGRSIRLPSILSGGYGNLPPLTLSILESGDDDDDGDIDVHGSV